MALPSKEAIRQSNEAEYRTLTEKGTVNLELKSPGDLLDEIVKLRKALETIQSCAYSKGKMIQRIARMHDIAKRALTIG